jgi:hypothetical protein
LCWTDCLRFDYHVTPAPERFHRGPATAAGFKNANDRVTFVASHGGWDEFPLITSGG